MRLSLLVAVIFYAIVSAPFHQAEAKDISHILFLLLSSDATEGRTTATSLTQHGITWHFDREYHYGQFANGDYWVVGPVKIIHIDPPSEEITGTTALDGFIQGDGPEASVRTMNGSMVNPSPAPSVHSTQGYDSDVYVWHPTEGNIYSPNYDKNLNVALNVSADNPLELPVNSSLVSTISHDAGSRPQLKTAAVLTVLSSSVPEGSFRPPYSGNDKTVNFNTSQIQYNTLPSLSPPSGLLLNSVSDIRAKLSRIWIDHFNHLGDQTMFSSPSDNMPNYGREYSILIGEAALLLFINEDERNDLATEDKEAICIGLIQLGIDNYGVLKNGGYWLNNGGLNSGRKWPILFAGIMLNNDDMKNVGNWQISEELPWHTLPLTQPFHEDAQTYYVTQVYVDATHVDNWGVYPPPDGTYIGPDYRDDEKIPYETGDIGMPEWSILANTTPHTSNNYWGTSYRQSSNANSWGGFVLAAIILESSASAKTLWNNDALFDYMDRYMEIQIKGDWTRQRSKFIEEMWDLYRGYYGTCYTGFSFGERQHGDCTTAGVVK